MARLTCYCFLKVNNLFSNQFEIIKSSFLFSFVYYYHFFARFAWFVFQDIVNNLSLFGCTQSNLFFYPNSFFRLAFCFPCFVSQNKTFKMLHENELINIEEDMILNPGYMIRRFTLNNRINGLKVSIINTGATINSVKLGSNKDEIIDGTTSNGDGHEWQSHVLGLDTLLLTTNSSQSVMYQLTSDNELIIIGKFKNQQQIDWFNPFYFNLVSICCSIILCYVS